MLPQTRSLIILLCSCAAIETVAAQGICFATAEPPAPDETPAEPTITGRYVVSPGRVTLSSDGRAEFTEQVSVRYLDGNLTAERVMVEADGQLQAIGSVRYEDPDMSVFAEDAAVDPDAERISFARAGFNLPKRPARGSAEQIRIENTNIVNLSNMLFTTCPSDQEDWALLAAEVELDAEQGFGTARGVRLRFRDVPIFWAPYFTFPIDDQRKSGFLTPNFSERDRTGLDVRVPYYLNLAPNYDLLIEPRYLSKRGAQLGSEFRYLLPSSDGQLDFEFLPDDDDAGGRTRRYVNLRHESYFTEGVALTAGIEQVSDGAYFEDLGDSLSVTSQTHLNRFLDIGFHAPYWSFVARFQDYQTIDTTIAASDRPYERMPQMLFEGRWSLGRLALDSSTELVNFDRNVGTTGWRFDATQELSMRFARAGAYLTPALAMRQTNYWLDGTAPGAPETPSRSLPIGSVDGGLKFERTGGEGGGWIHTLEPRMLYVHVPYEEQSALPVFDTILPDFNLVQLFRKYQFVGADRVADTSQLSFGVTTRLIDGASGRERLRATLGQTRYHEPPRVSLPDAAPSAEKESDYVAELSLALAQRWNLDVGYQWDSAISSTARTETRFEFRPQSDRLLGVGYRYRRDVLEQGDLSLVWPVTDRWRFIGRYSYSLLEREPLEQFVGLEFEACCWRVRLVGRNYVSRRTGETDSSVSVQFQLNGLGQGASAPEDLLDRGILGYRRNVATDGQ